MDIVKKKEIHVEIFFRELYHVQFLSKNQLFEYIASQSLVRKLFFNDCYILQSSSYFLTQPFRGKEAT